MGQLLIGVLIFTSQINNNGIHSYNYLTTIFISKTAYYAQVEAMSLEAMKKGNETVRHFALRVQQLVKKGWFNENAATINLKNNEIFTKGLPKN